MKNSANHFFRVFFNKGWGYRGFQLFTNRCVYVNLIRPFCPPSIPQKDNQAVLHP